MEHSLAHDLGEQYRGLLDSEFLLADGKERAAIVASGRSLVSLKPILDQYREKPERRKGTATAIDTESFIALVKRFASNASAIFAAPEPKPSLTAVFNYSPQTAINTDADWQDHRAVYEPRLSAEWAAWKAKNGAFMPQGDFAAFIEERAMDAVAPEMDERTRGFAELHQATFASPSELVALSRGLEVNVGLAVKNAVRLASGESAVTFVESHSDAAGKQLRVPNVFQVAIPVFYLGPRFKLSAWLRYKVSGGSIQWAYQLIQPEIVFEEAFSDIIQDVIEATELPVYIGGPER